MKRGRRSIFRPKRGGGRVQGTLTKVGMQWFRAARVRLAELTLRNTKQVSHADVIEYLARGEQNTRLYIRETKGFG